MKKKIESRKAEAGTETINVNLIFIVLFVLIAMASLSSCSRFFNADAVRDSEHFSQFITFVEEELEVTAKRSHLVSLADDSAIIAWNPNVNVIEFQAAGERFSFTRTSDCYDLSKTCMCLMRNFDEAEGGFEQTSCHNLDYFFFPTNTTVVENWRKFAEFHEDHRRGFDEDVADISVDYSNVPTNVFRQISGEGFFIDRGLTNSLSKDDLTLYVHKYDNFMLIVCLDNAVCERFAIEQETGSGSTITR
jgi:hypothetical protein